LSILIILFGSSGNLTKKLYINRTIDEKAPNIHETKTNILVAKWKFQNF